MLAPPPRIADRFRHRAHVGRQVAEVRQLRADGEVHDPQPVGPEGGEQALDGRHHHGLDAVEAGGPLLRPPLVLQQAAQALVPRRARVLHVHHHERDPRRLEAEPRIELPCVVRHAGRPS